MIGREIFAHLRSSIKSYCAKFVTIWSSFFFSFSNFLPPPSVNQKGLFLKPSKGSYRSFSQWLWEKFQLHQLVEIVQQNSDPDFAQLPSRVQEDQQTDNDVNQIKALANTDTATSPDEFVVVYLTLEAVLTN